MNKQDLVKAIMDKLSDKEEINKSDISKAVQEAILDQAKGELQDSVQKAVTSEAAPAENGPENDAQLNGEDKPSLQDAKSPQDAQEELEVKQQEVPENVDASQAQGGKTQEISFGNLLSDQPFSLGSTLQEGPQGNMITNIKKPQMDYVERAKNHKNLAITPDELKEEREGDMEKSKKKDLNKKQGVPEGVDPAKHERCVQQVKEQGHDKESAIRICNESLGKSGSVEKGGKLTVKQAVDKIMHDKWEVQDVLPKVPEDKRDDVLDKLRQMKNNK